jgi:hypothetical protein
MDLWVAPKRKGTGPSSSNKHTKCACKKMASGNGLKNDSAPPMGKVPDVVDLSKMDDDDDIKPKSTKIVHRTVMNGVKICISVHRP